MGRDKVLYPDIDFKHIQKTLCNWTHGAGHMRTYKGCIPCAVFLYSGSGKTIYENKPYSKWDLYAVLETRSGYRGVFTQYPNHLARSLEVDRLYAQVNTKEIFDPVINACSRIRDNATANSTAYGLSTLIFYVYSDSVIGLYLATDMDPLMLCAFYGDAYGIESLL